MNDNSVQRNSAPTGAQDSENKLNADRPLGGAACSTSGLLAWLFEDGNEQMLRDAVVYLKDQICTPKHIYKMTEREAWAADRLFNCIYRRTMPDDEREKFLSTGDAFAGVFH